MKCPFEAYNVKTTGFVPDMFNPLFYSFCLRSIIGLNKFSFSPQNLRKYEKIEIFLDKTFQ